MSQSGQMVQHACHSSFILCISVSIQHYGLTLITPRNCPLGEISSV